MKALSVQNLTKQYPNFTLDCVNFSVEEGRICALVGANGAGKSTTLKGISGLIPVSGEVRIFDIPASERAAKSLVGYAGGGFRFYPAKRVSAIAKAASMFYPAWDSERFSVFLERFGIAPHKRISELSEGMKVKFALALSLSHGARLLLLDEPTSGLDPLSREDFCDCMLSLVREEHISVLFSTHIVSDMAGIADNIVFLSNGKVCINESVKGLLEKYSLVKLERGAYAQNVIGLKEGKDGLKGLIPRGETRKGAEVSEPTLDDIVIHLEYERRKV